MNTSSNPVVLALYRATLRHVREAYQQNPKFRIISALDPSLWGRGKMLQEDWVKNEFVNNGLVDKFEDFVDNNDPEVDKEKLYLIIHEEYSKQHEDLNEAMQRGFQILSKLTQLRTLNDSSSVCVTNGIEVFATSHPVTSFIGKKPYVFTYRIRLRNVGDSPVKITHRHWTIADEKGSRMVVPKWAESLVGYKPTLKPGEVFEYYSGTDLSTKRGVMEGSLLAKRLTATGEEIESFEVRVNPFALITEDEPIDDEVGGATFSA